MKNEKLAVALKYPRSADCPFIAAKAKGQLAERIIKEAHKNNIPVVEDKIASKILSVQEIGEAIPEQTWEIVAKIFALVVESEKKV